MATRFGMVITGKTAAQIVPVIGGVAAAAIYTLLTVHYPPPIRHLSAGKQPFGHVV